MIKSLFSTIDKIALHLADVNFGLITGLIIITMSASSFSLITLRIAILSLRSEKINEPAELISANGKENLPFTLIMTLSLAPKLDRRITKHLDNSRNDQ